jgi:hypothetical protein
MFQLYHRISVVPECSPRREWPGDFSGGPTCSCTTDRWQLNHHISRHISKSPAAGGANSGSAAGISLLIAMAPVSGGQQRPWIYPGEAHIRANTGRAAPNPIVHGLLTEFPAPHLPRSSGHPNRTTRHLIRRPKSGAIPNPELATIETNGNSRPAPALLGGSIRGAPRTTPGGGSRVYRRGRGFGGPGRDAAQSCA